MLSTSTSTSTRPSRLLPRSNNASTNIKPPSAPLSTTTPTPLVSSSSSSSQAAGAAAGAGPSNVTLFLTNLRLLDLDLRSDWPGISTATFASGARADQKKRVQCVEWALYRLFGLWDAEETKDKLQPFFPPLEQLQSLNLRAALFRCLDQVKKAGVLGRDTVLRKTMLDECKGERLEEVLAVFSNAVLKKVVLERGDDGVRSIARELAYENFSYHGERSVLAALIWAHKASLAGGLREREGVRRKGRDFEEWLGLSERRIARREEQVREIVRERGLEEELLRGEVLKVQDVVRSNWTGSEKWLKEILYGETVSGKDGLLGTRFEKVWRHVEDGSIGELEGGGRSGLAEQLDARVKDQEQRLARWKAFGRKLEKKGPVSPSKKPVTQESKGKGYDLGFDKHQHLRVGYVDKEAISTSSPSLEKYKKMMEDMQRELAEVDNPKLTMPPVVQPSPIEESPSEGVMAEDPTASTTNNGSITNNDEEEWSSMSEGDEQEPLKRVPRSPPARPTIASTNSDVGSRGRTSVSRGTLDVKKSSQEQPKAVDSKARVQHQPQVIQKQRSISPLEPLQLPLRQASANPKPTMSHEAELADEILNSMAAASPSPKKRHTLSLAERTRLSMARNSHAKFADLDDDLEPGDPPLLSIKPRPSLAGRETLNEDAEPQKHADLIERTRKSMAGFEAAQKKAQIERRRSVKAEQKRQRQSSYFPRVQEEEAAIDSTVTGSSKMENLLEEEDPEYAAVFKSRPKIATSPGPSPGRSWQD